MALKIREAIGNQDSTLKEPVHKLTHSKPQHRGSSLKITWATRERDLLTNFKVFSRGTGDVEGLSPSTEVLMGSSLQYSQN